jgi:hypothetical protein
MYTGNGETREFPLPQENDGSVAYLVSPAGKAVRAKLDDAYSIRDGAAVFLLPPPSGWTVTFETPALLTGQGPAALAGLGGAQGLLVIYPDGSFKQLDRDPWELLAEVRIVIEEAGRLHAEAREAEAAAVAEIKALAAAAAGDLEGRLLGYGARAEDAIKAAVNGTAGELSEKLAVQLREIRNEHEAVQKELRGAKEYAKTLLEEMSKKVAALKEDANVVVREWQENVGELVTKAQDSLDRIKTYLNAVIESIEEKADQAERAQTDIQLATQAIREAVEEKAVQAEGRLKFFVQEEERVRSEFQPMIDKALELLERAEARERETGDREQRVMTIERNLENTEKRLAARSAGTILRREKHDE